MVVYCVAHLGPVKKACVYCVRGGGDPWASTICMNVVWVCGLVIMLHVSLSPVHLMYRYPDGGWEWKKILQKQLNGKCRGLRGEKKIN